MIDAPLAEFLHEGLAVQVGTRNERLRPSGVRGTAIKVDEDGTHLIVYVSKAAADRILPNLEANGQVAVVACRPTDDRACQVKGEFVEQWTATACERAFVTGQWEGFLDNLERIGIPRASVARWTSWPSIAIRIRAVSVFDQTPRPGTGGRLA